jgi:hypothetical protein
VFENVWLIEATIWQDFNSRGESIANDEQGAARARTGGYIIGLRTFGADRRVRDTASWWEFWSLMSSTEHALGVLLGLCCSAHQTRVTLGWQSILQKFRQGRDGRAWEYTQD